MKTAVFDLDGTLVDTAADLIGALNAVGARRGWPPLDPAAERAVAGRGGRALLRRGMEAAALAPDAALVEALVPEFLAAYEARIALESRPFPGAAEALDALAGRGWALAICTNKPEGLALALLDALDLRRRFVAILGADTLPVRKPDPEHFHETRRRAGGAPGRAVMIGDTATDRETARRAGAPCVLLRHGYAGEPLEALAPEAAADDLPRAAALLDGLLGA